MGGITGITAARDAICHCMCSVVRIHWRGCLSLSYFLPYFVAVFKWKTVILWHLSTFYFQSVSKSDVVRRHSVIYLLLRNQSRFLNEDRWAMKLMLLILLYSSKLYLFCFSMRLGFHPCSQLCGVCTSLRPWVTPQSFWVTWKHTVTPRSPFETPSSMDPHICWTTRDVCHIKKCFVWLPDLRWRCVVG